MVWGKWKSIVVAKLRKLEGGNENHCNSTEPGGGESKKIANVRKGMGGRKKDCNQRSTKVVPK